MSTSEGGGASAPEALICRAKRQCVQLIFRAVEKQRLPLSVASTGAILFQRFFDEFTLGQYDRFDVAVASCYLAAKIEFRSLSLRDLMMAALEERYDQEKEPHRFSESALMEFRRSIHGIEQILLLDIINFDFDIIQGPHAALAEMMTACKLEVHEQNALHEVAWSLANDSAYTTLSLQFSPSNLARGLLSLAVEWSEMRHALDPDALWREIPDGQEIRQEIKRAIDQLYVSEHNET